MEEIVENSDTILRNRKSSGKNKAKICDDSEMKLINDEKEREKSDVKELSDEPELLTSKKQQNEDKQLEKSQSSTLNEAEDHGERFTINIQFDLMAITLFTVAFLTRVYRLSEPNSIVFDELHFGKYVSLYMKNIFFFDQHPPMGKQIISALAHFTGFDGNFTFTKIGAEYTKNVPVFWLRFVPAICGSLLAPTVYNLLREMKLNRWTCALGGFLIVFDNALLTQSRFILMESMLLLFATLGLLYLLKFLGTKTMNLKWLSYGILSAIFLTCAMCVKYIGFYTYALAFIIICRHLWNMLPDRTLSTVNLVVRSLVKWLIFTSITVGIYLGTFYIHVNVLYKAGPHDSAMTSAFQASLQGGLASITKGQPLFVQHGSQITLRHTHGRTCWLHSHNAVYPLRYEDNRGSSHQQQVTCYSFKDVNNWWIVKRPQKSSMLVEEPDYIQHGEEVQLVHGITSRALNSHDVAAPVSPQVQEVAGYIDYNISMAANILWRVDLLNKEQTKNHWHAITSQLRLIHVATGSALKFTGRQLPDWGFNQHEVGADRYVVQEDTIWNVEEHRYTQTSDDKERERQMVRAEMIPTAPTTLTFWQKFMELQEKIFFAQDKIQSHMYSSDPLEWPLLTKGIAYWVDKHSNAQIHLLGNIVIWYSATFSIVVYVGFLAFYLMRRRRLCFDLPENEWKKFLFTGEIFLTGYLMHYLPYFFVERTLFLYNYFPALIFKMLLCCFVIEHIYVVLKTIIKHEIVIYIYKAIIVIWFLAIVHFFTRYSVFSYGTTKLTPAEIISLRLKDTWDFILHKQII